MFKATIKIFYFWDQRFKNNGCNFYKFLLVYYDLIYILDNKKFSYTYHLKYYYFFVWIIKNIFKISFFSQI